MADDSVDFKKVDAAFQHLADSDDGKAALQGLSDAIDGVAAQVSDLNDGELHYVLVHLVNQREAGPATDDELFRVADGAQVTSGFRILRAVPAEPQLALQRAIAQ